MKILVVDDQAEAAESLAQSLRDLTGCEAVAAGGLEAAMTAVQHGPPNVLVTESVLEGGDGFHLREALRENQPDLRTIFVTEYDLSEYEEYLDGAPVFYKPVDPKALLPVLAAEAPDAVAIPATPEAAAVPPGPATTDAVTADQRSQSARLRKLVGKEGFTGKLDQFDLVDIIQLCCISKRTGRLQIARRTDRGVLYLRGGQIVHAVTGELQGEGAAFEIVGWSSGQFSFDDGIQPEQQTIQTGWEHLVMEAVRRRDERTAAQAAEEAGDSGDADLANRSIGPYHLRRKIGQGTRTEVFEAVQTSMDRVVALKVLSPEFQGNDAAVQNFLANASAKANVQHPSILAVYEAGQHDGIYYYTREFVDGANLTRLHAEGRTLDDATALQCVKVAAEALSYLNQQKIGHPALTADDLYLGRDGRARLNNLASLDARTPTTQQDIRALSRMVTDCLPNGRAGSHGLRELLGRMLLDGAVGFLSWGALLQGVKALEPKVVPEDAFKLSARDVAANAAVLDAKRRQKRALILTTLGMIAVFWVVATVVYFKFFRVNTEKTFDAMVAIPAGEFIYQKGGGGESTGAYWIDEYEVTIGQYAQFVAALIKHPTNQYEHPDAPSGHRHDNVQWTQLYAVARSGGRFRGAPVDLNCPAVFVDWFDAYAYAKWKGHRLPTQVEWEKAARGADGNRFPWGNDPQQISKVNTSADFHTDGAATGEVDGFNRWSPVDAMTGDRSPYGVMDMAGNVSEWTADRTMRGKLGYPAVCGGNFGSPDVEVTRRVLDLPDLTTNDRVGFRTVSDTAPPAK